MTGPGAGDDLGILPARRRIDPPLDDVPRHDDRAGDHAVLMALLVRSRVEDDAPPAMGVVRLGGRHALEAGPGGVEQVIDPPHR